MATYNVSFKGPHSFVLRSLQEEEAQRIEHSPQGTPAARSLGTEPGLCTFPLLPHKAAQTLAKDEGHRVRQGVLSFSTSCPTSTDAPCNEASRAHVEHWDDIHPPTARIGRSPANMSMVTWLLTLPITRGGGERSQATTPDADPTRALTALT